MGCDQCWHTQLSIAVDPSELFRHYLYVSGTSTTLKEYFDWFAGAYHLPEVEKPRVLDIACNDGTQLDSFKALGWDTWGVDPAENLHPTSVAKGHNVRCAFWNSDIAQTLPKFDLITAQNVFAHTAEIDEFLTACKKVMKRDGLLVIQTSQATMFDRNEFDTIYHEHISFFSTRSMEAIARRHKLQLNKVYTTDIHGTSYVFELSKLYRDTRAVREQLDKELHRYNRSFYDSYRDNALGCLEDLGKYVDRQRAQGFKIIGYGAAAKGNTLLNFGDIHLDYIIDDNPMKQGLFAPGSNIPVVPIDMLDQCDDLKVAFVPLAWNFFKEISSKIKTKRDQEGDVFIKYFPTVSVN